MSIFTSRHDKEEIEAWGSLLEVIDPLIAYITYREETIYALLEKAKKNPSLDSAFITTNLNGKLEEFKELRREIEYRQELYNKEVSK